MMPMHPDAAGPGDIQPGDYYEDCAYHPCLCVGVDGGGTSVWGISLVDGSQPRCCDVPQCGVRRLSLEQAWSWKMHGPPDIELPAELRWWRS
jgi:hypothetical protein